jgi:hypothetical protein
VEGEGGAGGELDRGGGEGGREIQFYLLQKIKYDIGAEIRFSTCTLNVKAVLRSYSKIQPARYTEISRATI